MKLQFGPNGILMIDEARITHRNFSGAPSQYNREGDRNFSVIIPDQNIAETLQNDVNEDGAAWNVKIKPPREEDDEPFMYLPVKVRFNQYGPKVYLMTPEGIQRQLDEESVGILDKISIEKVDLDIRPYDNITSGRAYRTAYLQSIRVYQRVDRYDRFADYNNEA